MSTGQGRDQVRDQVRQVRWVRQVRQVRWVLVLVTTLLAPAVAWAQGGVAQNVEVEPVTCWWRTGASAIRVGQPFAVILTCSILETDAARAIVDRGRLGTAAVQFPPYEVIGGTQSADEVTPGRRFFQYEYVLRLIAEDAFGKDVAIPEMPLTYRIESAVQQDASVQGREQTYTLPPLPMRVQSLVASDATHIRETPAPTLGEIAAREFRGRMLRLVAGILFALAGLMVVFALVRGLHRRRAGGPVASRPLVSDGAILSGVRRELRSLQQETRQTGWTADTVRRALAAMRVVGSYAAARPVAQRATTSRPATDGEVVLKSAWSPRVAVSGASTAAIDDVELSGALSKLTAARYGRNDTVADGALDDVLDTGIRAAGRLGGQHTWLARTQRSVGRTFDGWRQRVWAR